MNKTSRMNKLKLIFFCAILGASSGAVLWIFLTAVLASQVTRGKKHEEKA